MACIGWGLDLVTASMLRLALKDGSGALASADAHRDDAVAAASAGKVVEEGGHLAGAGAAEWMTESDGATEWVDLLGRNAENVDAVRGL